MRFFRWITGIGMSVVLFVFAEGWLILAVKLLGFAWSTILVSAVTIALSWIVIYVYSGSHNIGRFRNWLKSKEDSLSDRAQLAVNGGKTLAIVNTTVFLGPIVASILMLMLGFERNKVYFYAVLCALFAALIWCGVYSGMFWGIGEFMAKKG